MIYVFNNRVHKKINKNKSVCQIIKSPEKRNWNKFIEFNETRRTKWVYFTTLIEQYKISFFIVY